MNSQNDLESDLESWLKTSEGAGLQAALSDPAANLPGERDLEVAPPAWCSEISRLEQERSRWRKIAGIAVAACLAMGFFSVVSLRLNPAEDSGMIPGVAQSEPGRNAAESNSVGARISVPQTTSFRVGTVSSRMEQSRKRLTALSSRSKFNLRPTES